MNTVKVEEHQNIARLINQSLISRRVSPRHPPQAFLLVLSFVSGLKINMQARELVNLQCTIRQQGHFEALTMILKKNPYVNLDLKTFFWGSDGAKSIEWCCSFCKMPKCKILTKYQQSSNNFLSFIGNLQYMRHSACRDFGWSCKIKILCQILLL